jgi:hypothetical protein
MKVFRREAAVAGARFKLVLSVAAQFARIDEAIGMELDALSGQLDALSDQVNFSKEKVEGRNGTGPQFAGSPANVGVHQPNRQA